MLSDTAKEFDAISAECKRLGDAFNAVSPAAQIAGAALNYVWVGVVADIKLVKGWLDTIDKFTFGGLIGAIGGIVTAFQGVINICENVGTAINNAMQSGRAAANAGVPSQLIHDQAQKVRDNPTAYPGHATGGVFRTEHFARIAERGTPEAVIP